MYGLIRIVHWNLTQPPRHVGLGVVLAVAGAWAGDLAPGSWPSSGLGLDRNHPPPPPFSSLIYKSSPQPIVQSSYDAEKNIRLSDHPT